MVLRCSQSELEAYLNAEALPLLGLSTVQARVRFSSASALLTVVRVGDDRPLGRLALTARSVRDVPPLGKSAVRFSAPAVSHLTLGPLAASPLAIHILESIALATLGSGEMGLRLDSVAFRDGVAYLTLSRR